jgi:hypothetical protein
VLKSRRCYPLNQLLTRALRIAVAAGPRSSQTEAAFLQAPELNPLHADSFSDCDLLPALLSCIEASTWEGEDGEEEIGPELGTGPWGSIEELGTGEGETGNLETGDRGSSGALGAGERERGGEQKTGNGKTGPGESGERESRKNGEQETAARSASSSGRPNSAGTADLERGQSGVPVEQGVKACNATFPEASPPAVSLIPHVTRKRPRQDLASSADIHAEGLDGAIGLKRPRKSRVSKAADHSGRPSKISPLLVEISRADSPVENARRNTAFDNGDNIPSTEVAIIAANSIRDQQKPPHLEESPVRRKAKACHTAKPARFQNESAHFQPLSETPTHIEGKASACRKGARSVCTTSPQAKAHVLDDLSFARQLAESNDPEDKIVAHALGCLSPGSELTEEEKRLREELVNRDPKEATEKMSKMTFEELSGYFELSLAAACKSLGVGRTVRVFVCFGLRTNPVKDWRAVRIWFSFGSCLRAGTFDKQRLGTSSCKRDPDTICTLTRS